MVIMTYPLTQATTMVGIYTSTHAGQRLKLEWWLAQMDTSHTHYDMLFEGSILTDSAEADYYRYAVTYALHTNRLRPRRDPQLTHDRMSKAEKLEMKKHKDRHIQTDD